MKVMRLKLIAFMIDLSIVIWISACAKLHRETFSVVSDLALLQGSSPIEI